MGGMDAYDSGLASRRHSNTGCGTISATATAVPPHVITRDDVLTHLASVFHIESYRLEAMTNIVGNAEIRKRHAIFPIDYTVSVRSLSQTNREYQEHAILMGRQVAEECLAKARLLPREIDYIITVSCTGFMIPSLDAHLINLIGFRADVRRLPITEIGCAGGAMALSRAWDFVRAFPGSNVLIVCVELPSLTFQRRDTSPANLICSILFGDGAAAALVTGRDAAGPRILGAETYTFPQSLDAMGFDLRETGFHIVLSREIPMMIRLKIREIVEKFLGRHELSTKDIAAFILHPGGQKLLSFIEEELDLCREDTQFSWDVLGEYGNLSSATILFILEEWLTRGDLKPGDYGLATAFGPGFSSELLLLQWT